MTSMDTEDSLWAEWTNRYAAVRSQLTRDGAGSRYFDSVPRVLAVLKEPNNSPGDDTRDLLNVGPQWDLWHALATWMAGLFAGFPPYREVKGDVGVKREALSRIAVMNLKKVSGPSSTPFDVLNRAAFRERDLLRRQLELLAPDVIIACGTFEPMIWLLDRGVPPQADLDASVLSLTGNRLLVRFRHPARSGGVKSYDLLRALLGHLELHRRE